MKGGKNKKGKCLIISIVILITIAVLMTLFSSKSGDEGKQNNTDAVVIGVPNWESAMGTAYILRELITKEFDTPVRLHAGTNEELYNGIADGTIHVHPEGWTPNHDDWHTKYSSILNRNTLGVNAIQALCVNWPLAEQYGIKTIEDLRNPENAKYFDSDGDGRGEAWIGAKGWGATTVEQVRAKSYGYDKTFELLQMDESAALRRLEEATQAGKLFLLYCYTPHWMWRVHDLLQIEEPPYSPAQWKIVFPSEDPQWLEKSSAPVAWKAAKLHIYYAKSLDQQYPNIARFLKRAQFTMEELLAITYDLEKGVQDPATYAKEWVAKNR